MSDHVTAKAISLHRALRPCVSKAKSSGEPVGDTIFLERINTRTHTHSPYKVRKHLQTCVHIVRTHRGTHILQSQGSINQHPHTFTKKHIFTHTNRAGDGTASPHTRGTFCSSPNKVEVQGGVGAHTEQSHQLGRNFAIPGGGGGRRRARECQRLRPRARARTGGLGPSRPDVCATRDKSCLHPLNQQPQQERPFHQQAAPQSQGAGGGRSAPRPDSAVVFPCKC